MRSNQSKDPARAARDRLLRLERQAKARAEATAVTDGVAETVALSRARGQAIAEPTPKRHRACAQPYRRQSGLEWLSSKGRIDAAGKAAGERYGWAYRRAKLEKPIPSTLDDRVRGPFVTPSIEAVIAHGAGTELARRKLGELRRRLLRQTDLVAACDLICGEEKTPREAATGEREAARLEAVLKVALDILAGGPGG
ncbi:MAG: hypothetical protein KKE02_09965 [Alphaproteobacteria bacterium]|nr:hypothetical protein [Alphaproteobacteria bacterium]MBU1516863.1 hypothetical protein [Alphaproteobacteria bacterium]MBU2092557.1 hypothetical protein [Alphaproteobacteria bacterium]MBU2151331.1 hypothetical protein [Alphaproteobacteria bacterium]MBU2309634.1 hypothetical protein [Alphaproteobacteria bacterium]